MVNMDELVTTLKVAGNDGMAKKIEAVKQVPKGQSN